MGHVQVAAVDHRLFPVQGLQIGQQVCLPPHSVVDAFELLLGIGGVAAYQIEGIKLQGDEPPLVVVLLQPHAVADAEGLPPGEHRCAGIPLFFSAVPILPVALQLQRQLAGLELGLLQAEDICVQSVEGVLKSLVEAGPQAVYIPGDQFHFVSSLYTPGRRMAGRGKTS